MRVPEKVLDGTDGIIRYLPKTARFLSIALDHGTS